jgi:hypothetical protein
MYTTGMYILSEGVPADFDKDLQCFFSQDRTCQHKYHMVKWTVVCDPKDHEGIGILVSHYMNVELMFRWVWRILKDDGGLSLKLVKAKYLHGRPLLACERREGSQFWRV